MGKLKDRVAVIIGAGGRGMGRSLALAMAREGARIVAVDIDGAGAERVIAEVRDLGGEGLAQVVDAADGEAIAEVMRQAVEHFGRLDILCNHCSALGTEIDGKDIDVVSTPIEVWDRTMDVNLRGPFLASKHAIPLMLSTAGEGCIINTSTGAAFLGAVTLVAYAASKAGLQSLTRSIATSHGKKGIRCNTIATGLVMSREAEAKASKANMAIYESNRLVKEVGRPEGMAALAVFLASEEGRYVTGQTYIMDGGHTAHQPWYAQSRDLHPHAFDG